MSTPQLPQGMNATVSGLTTHIQHEPVSVDDVISGAPTQGTVELGTIGGCEVGIWELREGVVVDIEVEEIFVVLSGEAYIDFIDASGATTETVTVRQGDVMRLAEGSQTRWTVPEHIRKVYIS